MKGFPEIVQTSGNTWGPPNPVMLHETLGEPRLPWPERRQRSILKDFERQMDLFEREHKNNVAEVRKLYVFPKDDSVEEFLNGHRAIPHVLMSAISHLKTTFGSDAVFTLRVPPDELGSRTIFAVALWPGAAPDARAALKAFDESWWIANVRQASGYLNFTYELV